MPEKKFKAIYGTKDILPAEYPQWEKVVSTVSRLASEANYGFIQPPIFEATELFNRGIGETTDIVTKEMYTFTDQGDRSLTLRPEGTASVVRAYVGIGRDQLPVPSVTGKQATLEVKQRTGTLVGRAIASVANLLDLPIAPGELPGSGPPDAHVDADRVVLQGVKDDVVLAPILRLLHPQLGERQCPATGWRLDLGLAGKLGGLHTNRDVIAPEWRDLYLPHESGIALEFAGGGDVRLQVVARVHPVRPGI